MTSAEQGLKPCPFCGKSDNFPCHDSYVDCKCLSGQYGVDIDIWNNAYCWKEIDSLKACIEELKKTLEIKNMHIYRLQEEVRTSKSRIEELEEKYQAALEVSGEEALGLFVLMG